MVTDVVTTSAAAAAKLEPRSVEIATATTELLVDTPQSAVLDLRQGSSELEKMTSRAVLIGNVMASPPVLEYVGRPPACRRGRIRAQPPLTPDFPRPLGGLRRGSEHRDLLKSTDQYRLNIQSNPTVPILQIYAQAPSARRPRRSPTRGRGPPRLPPGHGPRAGNAGG